MKHRKHVQPQTPAEQIAECRLALRVIEAGTWRGSAPGIADIDDVLRQWRRSGSHSPVSFFVRDLQPRQLALL